MKSKLWIFGVFILILVIGFSSAAQVDQKILNKFNSGADKVKVVVEYNNKNLRGFSMMAENEPVKKVLDLSLADFESLEKDASVSKIRYAIPIKVFMSDVVKNVSANDTWELELNGINLTGFSTSVCILDTGIDTDHPAFSKRVVAQKCFCMASDSGQGGCCPEGEPVEYSAEDDNGHGTHVAGIVGANGDIKGIAPNVNLVIVKIMNATGEGISTDLEDGIQWCVDNAETYNIRVITASLGGAEKFASACDDESALTTSNISAAVAKNISVLFATGNNVWSDGISWPSCISDAIPVSSVSKADAIAPYANRNLLVKLFGIGGTSGSMITSTYLAGVYAYGYGTSMATPGVAGAIAIINQVLISTNRNMTPSQIEGLLYVHGHNITEGANNYTRINIYEAVLSLDNIGPNVTLVSPSNNVLNWTRNQTFTCNATDWQLKNVTLKVWNSTELYRNISFDVTGNTSNQSSFNVADMPLGEYQWNCEYYDSLGNFNLSSANFTLHIGGVAVSLIVPLNNTYTKVNETNFTCNLTTEDNTQLLNTTFYLWNSTSLVYNETVEDFSGISEAVNFTYNLTKETGYIWNCLAFSNNTNSSWAAENYTITFDVTATNISSVSSGTPGTTSAVISWTTGEEANSTVYYGTSASTSSTPKTNSANSTSHSITLSGLVSSTKYYYNVSSCDRAGNCNNSVQYSFTTATPAEDDEGDSGGGGGDETGAKSYFPTSGELDKGYTKKISAEDKIYVNISSVRHSITLSKLTSRYAEILIQSNPIKVNVSSGDSIKVNVSSTEYYDLEVTLNSILNDSIEITVKGIHEEIKKSDLTQIEKESNYTAHNETSTASGDEEKSGTLYVVLGIVVVLAMAGLGYFVMTRDANKLKEDEYTTNIKNGSKKIKAKTK